MEENFEVLNYGQKASIKRSVLINQVRVKSTTVEITKYRVVSPIDNTLAAWRKPKRCKKTKDAAKISVGSRGFK